MTGDGDRLDERLICRQCGQPYVDQACGPTHAVIGGQVSRAPDLERELVNVRRELRDAQAEIERLRAQRDGQAANYIANDRIMVAELAAERAKVQRVEALLYEPLLYEPLNHDVLRRALAGGEDR